MQKKYLSIAQELFSYVGKSYFILTFIGRLPLAMIVIGITTLVLHYTNSHYQTGIISAVAGASSALSAQLIGKLSDNFGQKKVLIFCAIMQSLLTFLLLIFLTHNSTYLIILITSFGVGFFSPQVSALVRARWLCIFKVNKLKPDKENYFMSITLSYESMIDEITFVLGPILVGILASTLNPCIPLLLGGLLTLIFVISIALHPTEKFVRGLRKSYKKEVSLCKTSFIKPVIITSLFGMLFIGFTFGSTLNSLAAFMDSKYSISQTGIVYGAMGLGSASFAFLVIFLPEKCQHAQRWIIFATISLLSSLFLYSCDNIFQLSILLFAIGTGLGPTIVTLFNIGSKEVNKEQASSIMTLFTSGIIVGQAIGSAISGLIAQNNNYNTAFLCVVISSTLLFILSLFYKFVIDKCHQ